MNILFDINHPAHVHFFKNPIKILKTAGHSITITARDKDVTTQLLENDGQPYILLSKAQSGILGLGFELLQRQIKLSKILKEKKIQLCVSIAGTFCVHIARLLKIPCLIFHDSEVATVQNKITFPFADLIATPFCYREQLGKKHIRYDGYHELAYLHPNYFQPDPQILQELDLKEQEPYFVLRFVAWKASHDIGKRGFRKEQKKEIVKLLKNKGRVYITSEKPLEDEFEEYRIKVPPEKIHNVLSFATMLITESQTMTTEAALLGTPAIRCNSFVGANDMGNFVELEQKYDLIYSFNDFDKAVVKTKELLSRENLKEEWQNKKEQLFRDKIDVTQWMVDLITSRYLNEKIPLGQG